MSAPMSVKERIAMMKQKEEEAKVVKTPEPVVRRASLTPKVEAASIGQDELQSAMPSSGSAHDSTAISTKDSVEATPPTMSIAERMAALRANQTVSPPSAIPPPPPPTRRSSLPASFVPPTPPPPPPPQRSERPISMRQDQTPAPPAAPAPPAPLASAAEEPVKDITTEASAGTATETVSTTNNMPVQVPPPPPPSRRSSMPPSISAPPPPPPPSASQPSLLSSGDSSAEVASSEPPPPPTHQPSASTTGATSAAQPPPPPPPIATRRSSMPPSLPASMSPSSEGAHALSLAERMAALRNASSPPGPPPPPPRPTPSTPEPPTSSASSASSLASSGAEPASTGKMTIAERMAALKASSAADEAARTPVSGGGGSNSGTPGSSSMSGRRLSVGLAGLGAKINLAALSPNAVRPTFGTPKRDMLSGDQGDQGEEREKDSTTPGHSSKVSFSSEDGEIKHLSLSRPAVPSMRRKHATASVRLQANAWATEDILPAGLRVSTPSTRPISGSSTQGDPASVLTENSEALSSVVADADDQESKGENAGEAEKEGKVDQTDENIAVQIVDEEDNNVRNNDMAEESL